MWQSHKEGDEREKKEEIESQKREILKLSYFLIFVYEIIF